jgi:polysaccharide export outer membrane protein
MTVERFFSQGGSVLLLWLVIGLGGCSSFPTWIPSSGPSRDQVLEAPSSQVESLIQVVDVTDPLARRLAASQKRVLFSETLGAQTLKGFSVGPGDVIEVSIWEAPPAVLFGTAVMDPRGGIGTSRVTVFPEQMVSTEGHISIPFAGAIPVKGKTPQQVEAEVARRLKDKANQPQVLVRVIRNATANVTVVGEVATSTRMPLTAKGERLLDALAASGGVRQPVGKISMQVTRGETVQTLPLDLVIQDPKQNIVLQPGDVVTALHQPLSFTALGATGKNEEIFFEAQGITLAQALARSGGMQDMRSDAHGVFIFRFEEPLVLGMAGENPQLTPDGKVPVVYRVNLKDPAMFFVAQGFPMRNKDVIYIANAPGAEMQKFLNLVVSAFYPVLNAASLLK